MLRPTHLIVSLLLTLCALSLAPGQDVKTVTNPGIIPIVTVSASAERLRLTAPGTVVQMQLQIYNDAGQLLFDVTSKGNVLDWTLQDSGGERLVPGSYLCVVTVKSLSGKLSQRIGQALIQEKQVELQRVDATQLTAPQQQAVGPIEENAALTVLKAGEGQATTVLANNGQEGQIIRDRGALSFRIGDFFSGNDQEQMRLTEAGNLGIGTANPQFKLDVAGAVRARQGFVFNDGSTLSVNEKGALILTGSDGTVAPNAAGTGTQNHLAKWIETGGAGTLGDSSVTELANGFVGIGTVSPTVRLDVVDDTSGVGGFQLTNHTNGSTAQLQNRLANNTGAFAYYGITSSGYTQAPILSNRAFFGSFQVDTVIWTQTANDILFATNGLSAATERMRIKSSGRVGIGTDAPVSKLDVAGDISTSGDYKIAGIRVFSVDPLNSNTFAGIVAGIHNTGFNNSFFGDNAGESNTSGRDNSFFGTEAGSSNVLQPGNSYFGSHAGRDSTGNANSFFGANAGITSTTGGANTFIGDETGETNRAGFANTLVGEGTDVGAGNLDHATAIGGEAVVSTSNTIALGRADGSDTVDVPGKLQIDTLATSGSTGPLCLNSSNRVGQCSSSLRYKTAVQPFLGGLNIINRLRPISFTWKADGMRDLGLGAEEVESVEPLLTFRNKKGEIEGVKYNQLSAVLVNAIKEEQQQIRELQSQIFSLRNQLHKHSRHFASGGRRPVRP